jgi:hypothetical protein
MLWAEETSEIKRVSERYGVDPCFVAAIRKAENGGEGREFGVLSVEAPSYARQLAVTCGSTRNSLVRFGAYPFEVIRTDQRNNRLVYNRQFVRHFQERWAPEGVSNDPTDLNKNWYSNVLRFYHRFAMEGL